MDDIELDSLAMLYGAVVIELGLDKARTESDAKELLLAGGALADVPTNHVGRLSTRTRQDQRQ